MMQPARGPTRSFAESSHDQDLSDSPYTRSYSPVSRSTPSRYSPVGGPDDFQNVDEPEEYDAIHLGPVKPRRSEPPSFAAIRAATPTTYTSLGSPIRSSPVSLAAYSNPEYERSSSYYPSPTPSPAPSQSQSFIVYPRPPVSPAPVPSWPIISTSRPTSHATKSRFGFLSRQNDHQSAEAKRISSQHRREGSIGDAGTTNINPVERPVPPWLDKTYSPPSYRASPVPAPAPIFPINGRDRNAALADDHLLQDPVSDDENTLPSWMTPVSPPAQMYDHVSEGPPKKMSIAEKEARVRLLEAAFAHQPSSLSQTLVLPGLASLTRGTIIFRTQGRLVRALVRSLQLFASLASLIACVYALLFLHPNPKAPPEEKWQTYALYGYSVLSTILMLHWFFLRRWRPFRILAKNVASCCGCCRRGKSKRRKEAMMKGRGGKPIKKNSAASSDEESDENGAYEQARQPVLVNVVLDPRYLTSAHPSAMASHPSLSLPPASGPAALFDAAGDPIPIPSAPVAPSFIPSFPVTQARTTRADRVSWKKLRTDRRTLNRLTTLDILLVLTWSTIFVLLFSSKCSPGSFQGWCNAYNTGRAAALIIALLSLVGVLLDIQDVRALNWIRRVRDAETAAHPAM